MFKRDLPDGRTTKLLWLVYNLQGNLQSEQDASRSLFSSVVCMQDQLPYLFELRTSKQQLFQCRLIIHAIPTTADEVDGFQPRKLYVEPYIFKNDQSVGQLKDQVVALFTKDQQYFEFPVILFSFIERIKHSQHYDKRLPIQFKCKVGHYTVQDAQMQNVSRRKLRRYQSKDEDVTDRYQGLVNEG